MSARLAIAAAAALAGLSALGAAARKAPKPQAGSRSIPLPMMGSRSKKHGRKTLWVGTHDGNLDGILERGLVPRGGTSPHRTKSNAVFLTDEPEAALMYASADPRLKPVLIKVDVDGLDLFPDTDDVGPELSEYLSMLEEKPGVQWPEDGMTLTEEQAEAIEEAIEEIEEEDHNFNISASVNTGEDGEQFLVVYPGVCLPVDERAKNVRPEIYEHLYQHHERGTCLPAGQWQHYGPIDKSRIVAVYTPSPGGPLKVKSHGRLHVDCSQIEVEDLIGLDDDLRDALVFRVMEFQKMKIGSANGQLPERYPYRGRRDGFLTKKPSKRAKILIQRASR
jgi:hypothetical protein